MKLALLPVFLVASAIASADQSPKQACTFTEEFNPSGWEIPGLADSKVVQAGAQFDADGVGDLHGDTLDPREVRASLLVLLCDSKHAGRLEVRNQPVNVHAIFRFRRSQRVFAYRVIADRAEIEDGEWIPVGESEMLVYYDVDGSGKFKLRRGATLFKLEVPEWVKSETGR
jgi:hypothetical protein